MAPDLVLFCIILSSPALPSYSANQSSGDILLHPIIVIRLDFGSTNHELFPVMPNNFLEAFQALILGIAGNSQVQIKKSLDAAFFSADL